MSTAEPIAGVWEMVFVWRITNHGQAGRTVIVFQMRTCPRVEIIPWNEGAERRSLQPPEGVYWYDSVHWGTQEYPWTINIQVQTSSFQLSSEATDSFSQTPVKALLLIPYFNLVSYSLRELDITHRFLAEGRPVDALAALVQLRHDDALRLVGARLCWEVEDVRLVHLLVQLVQQEILENEEMTAMIESQCVQHTELRTSRQCMMLQQRWSRRSSVFFLGDFAGSNKIVCVIGTNRQRFHIFGKEWFSSETLSQHPPQPPTPLFSFSFLLFFFSARPETQVFLRWCWHFCQCQWARRTDRPSDVWPAGPSVESTCKKKSRTLTGRMEKGPQGFGTCTTVFQVLSIPFRIEFLWNEEKKQNWLISMWTSEKPPSPDSVHSGDDDFVKHRVLGNRRSILEFFRPPLPATQALHKHHNTRVATGSPLQKEWSKHIKLSWVSSIGVIGNSEKPQKLSLMWFESEAHLQVGTNWVSQLNRNAQQFAFPICLWWMGPEEVGIQETGIQWVFFLTETKLQWVNG